MDDRDRVRRLLRQQSAIAGFGSFALRQSDLQTVLDEAGRACAKGLEVRFCKIYRYQPLTEDLLVVAGVGWREGVVGSAVSRADVTTPQGRAFTTGAPTTSSDLKADRSFLLPDFYQAHGIVSTIDVPIKGQDRPYGVLEVDSDTQHDYDQHDIDFLTGFANVLAEAVSTAERTAVLQAALAEMRSLVLDKDMLLDRTRMLAQELQHRVRLDRAAGAECVLTIGDTGPGFVAAPQSKRHGIGLVRRLAEQIGGSATLSAPPGAIWTITFPASA
jgi:GAF domain-containing protein